jgi:hypothetical protein
MKPKFTFKLMELKLENLYDDGAFYVEQSNWKTWKSFDKDGNALVTSLAQETCVAATRYYLKGKQEGWGKTKTYSGKVDGKL